jgi:hypothetical protein
MDGGEKMLSGAARETLIKAVAQSTPTYYMSCFLLTSDTCKKITSAISNCWWGSAADGWGMHWKKWSELTLPKVYEGMGFKDIKKFNLAMLGKQGWRLMTNPSSLCAWVLKGKYYPTGDFMSARRKKNSSYTWVLYCQADQFWSLVWFAALVMELLLIFGLTNGS